MFSLAHCLSPSIDSITLFPVTSNLMILVSEPRTNPNSQVSHVTTEFCCLVLHCLVAISGTELKSDCI